MPSITVNGLNIEVKQGTTVLQAVTEAGIEIPHYCYHPGLSIVGSCRMCQVEIDGMPKLQVACNTPVKDGMTVTTNSDKVKKARNAVLEFLLLNHPLDCPVCDQAGECGLQDYYMRYGGNGSRLADDKLKRLKAKQIGPHVMLDQDRCILCSRCIRFCQEIPKTGELGVFNRGDRSVVDVYGDRELNNRYSGNVVDICPVGALTDKDFRFQVRVWYLREGSSLCTSCSRGCNIRTYYNPTRRHHAGGRRVVRLKPRYNEQVNKWWMCDEGRYNYRYLDDNRLTQPLLRKGGKVKEMTWKQIVPELAADLKKIMEHSGPEAVAVLGSLQLANEDLYLIRKFFQESLGVRRCAFGDPADKAGFGDDLLITPDKNPNRRGAQALGWTERFESGRGLDEIASGAGLKALIVFRQDLSGHFPEGQLAEFVKTLDLLAFVGTNRSATSDLAHFVLPAATHVERDGTFTNVGGLVQRFFRVLNPLGEARPDWQIVEDLAQAMGTEYNYRRCVHLFNEMSRSHAAFAGLSYEEIGTQGKALAERVGA